MVWSLDLDDFIQVCSSSNTKYPLVTKMAEILLKAENKTLPTQSPTRAPRTTSKPTSVTKTKHQTEKPGYTHKPKYPGNLSERILEKFIGQCVLFPLLGPLMKNLCKLEISGTYHNFWF